MRALYLHKRDFRFFDNGVLHWLNENRIEFAAAYIWEPSLMVSHEFSDMHQFAVSQALNFIRTRYEKQQIPLIECVGEVVEALGALHQDLKFDLLVSHIEHGTTFTFLRDLAVKEWCKSNNVRWVEFHSSTVKRGLKSRDDREKLWNAHMAERLHPVPQELVGLRMAPDTKEKFESSSRLLRAKLRTLHEGMKYGERLQAVSEKAAHEVLQDFLIDRSIKYRGGISSPNSALVHGSRLSVHLAWGTISVRCVYKAALQRIFELQNPMPDGKPTAEQKRHYLSIKSFTARLHWRDHFIQRLEDQPDMVDNTLSAAFQDIPFCDNSDRLQAWMEGRTGEPIVDACMRCLAHTGFVNFRMRSMCISYGVYALHLDWRVLGRAIAQHFYDFEPGIHWSQVQMQAGVVGINTIRVYSPEKQLFDQDPYCEFVKKWIPELAGFEPDEIKNYSNFLSNLLPYPSPIVDFKSQSSQMKKIIYGIKNGEENQKLKTEVTRRHGSRTFRPSAKKRS